MEDAIAAPRIHVEGARLHVEEGVSEPAVAELERRGYEPVRWRGLNIYFGGVSAVTLAEDGRLEAAGDPRRGGAGIVVA